KKDSSLAQACCQTLSLQAITIWKTPNRPHHLSRGAVFFFRKVCHFHPNKTRKPNANKIVPPTISLYTPNRPCILRPNNKPVHVNTVLKKPNMIIATAAFALDINKLKPTETLSILTERASRIKP